MAAAGVAPHRTRQAPLPALPRWSLSQLAHPYRTMILRAMETVVSNHISELDKDVARAAVLRASSEMTRAKVCGVAGPAWLSPAPERLGAGVGLAASAGPWPCAPGGEGRPPSRHLRGGSWG